jgi:hypothetical protein
MNYGKLKKLVCYHAKYPQTKAGNNRFSATRLEQGMSLVHFRCHHKQYVSIYLKPLGMNSLFFFSSPVL